MTCATCHKDGVAGAPKFADEAAWAPYIETGYDELLHIALNGKGAMPAKGGNTSLDDLEVERAMVYMANAAGADFDEPEGGEGGADESEGDSAEAADATADTDADSADEPATDAAEQSEDSAAQDGDKAADESAAVQADDEAAAGETAADSAADESADSADNAADKGAAGDDEFAATAEQLEIGKQLYSTSCLACHATGIAGAPALGNAEAWQPYIETGLDTMLEVAINGKGAMPPRGASQATDEELKAAILYMVSESR